MCEPPRGVEPPTHALRMNTIKYLICKFTEETLYNTTHF